MSIVSHLVRYLRRRADFNTARKSFRHYRREVDAFCNNSFVKKTGTITYTPFVIVVFGGDATAVRRTSQMIAGGMGVSYLDMERLSLGIRRGFSDKEKNLFACYLAHQHINKGPMVINVDLTSYSVRGMAQALLEGIRVEPICILSASESVTLPYKGDAYLSSGAVHKVIFEKGKDAPYQETVKSLAEMIFSKYTI